MNTCPAYFLLWVGSVVLLTSLALAGVWRLSLDYRWIFSEAFTDGLGVQIDTKGWKIAYDTFIFSSLIFTQFVSFHLFFTSARAHPLSGFMPLLLFPIRQFIPVA